MASRSDLELSSEPESGYTFGHSKTTLSMHATRTIEQEGAFLLHHLKSHHRVLDVGCGPGSITLSLCKYVPDGSVTGIDISPEALEQARTIVKASPENHLNNVLFFCMDIQKDIVEEEPSAQSESPQAVSSSWLGNFDIIWTSHTLIHLSDPVGTISRLRKLLKPGTGLLGSCDGDTGTQTLYPDPTGVLSKFGSYVGRVLCAGGAPVLHGARYIPAYYVLAGFRDQEISVSIGGVSHRGEQRRRWADLTIERFGKGQHIHETLIKQCGVSEDECDDLLSELQAFANCENGLFFMAHVQIIARMARNEQ